MFYDHESIRLLSPDKEPSASARFRQEYTEASKEAKAGIVKREPYRHPNAGLLRAQLMGRMTSFLRIS